MILPNTPTPLLSFADQSGINPAEIRKFIEAGGIDYFMNAWVAYSVQHLKDTKFMDDMTKVGAYDQGRLVFGQIAQDFLDQLDKKEGKE